MTRSKQNSQLNPRQTSQEKPYLLTYIHILETHATHYLTWGKNLVMLELSPWIFMHLAPHGKLAATSRGYERAREQAGRQVDTGGTGTRVYTVW